MKTQSMKAGALAIGLTAILSMAGCGNHSSANSAYNSSSSTKSTPASGASTSAANSASVSASPEDLGKIGAEIKKHPKEAQKILADHGMDEKSFEKAIRQVASKPDDSRRYRDAYKKAGA